MAVLCLILAVTASVVAVHRAAGAGPGVALAASAPPVATTQLGPAAAPPVIACHDAPVATQAKGSSVAIPLRPTASAAPTTASAPKAAFPPTTGGTAAATTTPTVVLDQGTATAACNPTPEQAAAAKKLVDDTRAAIARFARPSDAVAAGYVASWSDNSMYTRVSHYAKWSNWGDGKMLDPQHPEGLLYGNTDHHGTILLGAFYLAEGDARPDPGGCLMHWHQHDGSGPWMMHVWTVPMQGGPFADNPDPAYIASL